MWWSGPLRGVTAARPPGVARGAGGPCGGGAGRIVRADVVARAFEEVYGVPAREVRERRRVVGTEPGGREAEQGDGHQGAAGGGGGGGPAPEVRRRRRVVVTEPGGRELEQGYVQQVAQGLEGESGLTIVCGRY